MSGLLFCLIALAVYRGSYMLAKEEGPFSIFLKLRDKVDPLQITWLGRGIRCPMCVSFWAGIIAALVWLTGAFDTVPGLAVLLALGASAVTVILVKLLG